MSRSPLASEGGKERMVLALGDVNRELLQDKPLNGGRLVRMLRTDLDQNRRPRGGGASSPIPLSWSLHLCVVLLHLFQFPRQVLGFLVPRNRVPLAFLLPSQLSPTTGSLEVSSRQQGLKREISALHGGTGMPLSNPLALSNECQGQGDLLLCSSPAGSASFPSPMHVSLDPCTSARREADQADPLPGGATGDLPLPGLLGECPLPQDLIGLHQPE